MTTNSELDQMMDSSVAIPISMYLHLKYNTMCNGNDTWTGQLGM